MGCTPTTHKEDRHLHKETSTHILLNPKEVSDKATSTIALLDYFPVRHMFKFINVLGHGKFGVVFKAKSLEKANFKVAIKIVKINSVYERGAIAEEKKILKELNHPNIVKYLQEYEDDPYLYIVTEFCSGGSLFNRLATKEVLTEGEAAKIIEKLFSALQYFHSKNIAHRDIKPEHILFSSPEENAEIKLIDFGFAKRGDCSCPAYQTVVGTPYYVAPEVIDGEYSYSCDIWSVGVIMHYMLSGEMPFSGATVEELFCNIKQSKLSFEKAPWKKVSDLGKDLLGKLLESDISKRLDASEALRHGWFSHCREEGKNELDRGILKKWKLEQGLSKFKNNFLNILASSLREEDVNELLYLYNVQDTSRDGYITVGEIIDVFHKRFPHIDLSSLEGCDRSQSLAYSSLISSVLDTIQFLEGERYWTLFQYFDRMNNGFITGNNLIDLMLKLDYKEDPNKKLLDLLAEQRVHPADHVKYGKYLDVMTKLHVQPNEDVIAKLFVH